MIDMIKISIPFKLDYCNTTKAMNGKSVSYVNLKECSVRGVTLESKSLSVTGHDEMGNYIVEADNLRHPYEALPTSFTAIAFKIFSGTITRFPCIELKASPAKIIQGHNLFGSDDLELGVLELIAALAHSYPDIIEMLDVQDSVLDLIDATYSCRVDNSFIANQVIAQLKNVSNGHLRRAVKNEFETTCYFNKNSRHVDRKVYLKEHEYLAQIKKYTALAEKGNSHAQYIVDAMSDPRLINYSRNLVRFEASIKRRYLDEFAVPQRLFDSVDRFGVDQIGAISFFKLYSEKENVSIVQRMWEKAFSQLFKTFQGAKMNLFDDSLVRDELRLKYSSITKTGKVSYAKPDRLFRFYRSIMSDGYDNVKDTFHIATFNKSLVQLSEIGLSKAQLQQINGIATDVSNVVSFTSVINFEFSNQFPSWYVEPLNSPIASAYQTADFARVAHIKLA
ncbi:MAG: replication initiation protein [Inoviridae sp.]|nr:MAG: replication initiation protein [Inoviridae sp.]